MPTNYKRPGLARAAQKRQCAATERITEIDALLRSNGHNLTPEELRLLTDERTLLYDYIHILKLQTDFYQQ